MNLTDIIAETLHQFCDTTDLHEFTEHRAEAESVLTAIGARQRAALDKANQKTAEAEAERDLWQSKFHHATRVTRDMRHQRDTLVVRHQALTRQLDLFRISRQWLAHSLQLIT